MSLFETIRSLFRRGVTGVAEADQADLSGRASEPAPGDMDALMEAWFQDEPAANAGASLATSFPSHDPVVLDGTTESAPEPTPETVQFERKLLDLERKLRDSTEFIRTLQAEKTPDAAAQQELAALREQLSAETRQRVAAEERATALEEVGREAAGRSESLEHLRTELAEAVQARAVAEERAAALCRERDEREPEQAGEETETDTDARKQVSELKREVRSLRAKLERRDGAVARAEERVLAMRKKHDERHRVAAERWTSILELRGERKEILKELEAVYARLESIREPVRQLLSTDDGPSSPAAADLADLMQLSLGASSDSRAAAPE